MPSTVWATQADWPGDGTKPQTTLERFTGRYDKKFDTDTGLVEMGVRPYDPALGRFYAVDPVVGGGANDYEYANQDPVNGYDLNGRDAKCVARCAILTAVMTATCAVPCNACKKGHTEYCVPCATCLKGARDFFRQCVEVCREQDKHKPKKPKPKPKPTPGCQPAA